MKLLNTAEAGSILGVAYHRIHTLIAQGHLKDYAERNPEHKKHYAKLSEIEVREHKKHFKFANRGVIPRNSGNGHAPIQTVHVPSRKKTEETIEEQIQRPIVSISQRLEGIETRLNELNEQIHQLIKMWS